MKPRAVYVPHYEGGAIEGPAQHLVPFDVVLVKGGKSPASARPKDLRRLPVVAENDLDARLHADVVKFTRTGRWLVAEVLRAGTPSAIELRAAERERARLEGPPDLVDLVERVPPSFVA